jgi:N-acetylneuraminate synthase/N,N'-diacetyllegionaminate synthase
VKVLGLVTARGGSKGFPGKNLALLGGRALVGWSHAVLDEFRRRLGQDACQVFLSTDSEAIAQAWPEPDRPARLRPAALASDTASSLDVVLHEIRAMEAAGGQVDAVLLLQPTSPLVDVQDLWRAWELFRAGSESVLGVVPVDHPVQWTWTLDGDQRLCPAKGVPEATRRQDLETRYRPAGFYLVTPGFLAREGRFIVPGASKGVVLDPSHGIDIDTPLDLLNAEAALRARCGAALFPIGARTVGAGNPCYVIAEAGVNHNGSLELALEMVRAAAGAGADAIKFQTFRAESLVSAQAPMARYQKANTGTEESQLEMLRKLELSADAFRKLQDACVAAGIEFLSTPFESASARLLDGMGVPAFKVGSGEITNLPFLEELAALGKPILLSTGMATLDEVIAAVQAVRRAGAPPLALLHCTSAYPADPAGCNLRAMANLAMVLEVPVGYSDHTTGWDICLAAVALGAAVIEKHFTLDRALPGPDHAASLEPDQLKAMVREIRRVEAALGDGVKVPRAEELDTRDVARKSLVFARAVGKGTVLQAADVTIKRPGTGIPPSQWAAVIGRTLKVDAAADQQLAWQDLEGLNP